MAKPKENVVYSREHVRCRVIEAIHQRLLFNAPSNSIVLKPLVHLKEIDSSDVHTIVIQLAHKEQVIKIIDPTLYTINEAKIARYKEKSHENIYIDACEKFSAFYEAEELKYGNPSRQKSTATLTAAKKEIATYQKILLGIAVAKYDFDPENLQKKSGVAKAIHGSLTKAGLGDLLTIQTISRKLKASANRSLDDDIFDREH